MTLTALIISTVVNVVIGASSVYQTYCLRTGKCKGMPGSVSRVKIDGQDQRGAAH